MFSTYLHIQAVSPAREAHAAGCVCFCTCLVSCRLVLQPVQRMVERVREMAEDPLMLAAARNDRLTSGSGAGEALTKC